MASRISLLFRTDLGFDMVEISENSDTEALTRMFDAIYRPCRKNFGTLVAVEIFGSQVYKRKQGE